MQFEKKKSVALPEIYLLGGGPHTHTHTNIYIYIYIFFVCMKCKIVMYNTS